MNDELKKLCLDIKATVNALEANLDLVTSGQRGWKAAALRARKESRALDKLGLAFRKMSRVAEKEK